MSQHHYNNNAHSFNTTNSFNKVLNNCTITDDQSRILTWLSPLEPKLRHQGVRESRVENVGEWLLQTPVFRDWYTGSGGDEADNSVLFCYGDPGVGKTYISSLVIDRLCDRASEQNAIVACFYFDFAAQKEQSLDSMLGALLKQVVSGLGEMPKDIVRAYEEQKRAIGGRGPDLGDIVKMLQATSSSQRTFICIDALDECVAGYRFRLLDSLKAILQKSTGTRIFVTGRPHIRGEVEGRLAGGVAILSIIPSKNDIIEYIRMRLSEDMTPEAMDSSLEAEILRKIPEKVSEIFLLVSLNIEAILRETTVHRRRQKLSEMTDGLGLGDAYTATLDRVKAQGGERARLGMAALMWVSHSERPLHVDELCHALAVEIGCKSLNIENVPSIRTLLGCCQGLIVVDKGASTVRLIHFTLQEYLRILPNHFLNAHSTIAETCLSYLNSPQVRASADLQDTPFLQYASLYWGTHTKRELSDCTKTLALELFGDYNGHISGRLLVEEKRGYKLYPEELDNLCLFTGLHCVSIFGIIEIAAALIKMRRCDINQEDCVGCTPLIWAAWNGNEAMVEILLGREEVNPDQPDKYGGTPLWGAAGNGHEGVVKLLLGREEVNPDQPNDMGETPLCRAAGDGHEGVVKLLLGREEVNPDQPNNMGETPLCRAAGYGHEGVVKLLLGREEVNPDQPNSIGETPLWGAADNGHEGVVKLLLGREEVNPDQPNNIGETPLWLAARKGHEGVVKLLLGREEVNPDQSDEDGQTPLGGASLNGHEGVVKLLLGREEVNPDQPNEYGDTPLWGASLNGHEGVVKLLLAREEVNPDRPNVNGETPLWRAARFGHEGVVKLLLGREVVNPDRADNKGNTPLSQAIENGHAGLIALLQPQKSASPSQPITEEEAPPTLPPSDPDNLSIISANRPSWTYLTTFIVFILTLSFFTIFYL